MQEKLLAHFPPDAISWRVGSTNKDKTKGLGLAYIDQRDVMRRLDEVCGMDGWQTKDRKDGDTYYCELSIKMNNLSLPEPVWITKTGAAGATQVEGEKGGASDAFKRAAVLFGVGRYLYDLENIWVALEPCGNSYKIKESEYPRLRSILAGTVTPVDDTPQKIKAEQIIARIKSAVTPDDIKAVIAAEKDHCEALPDFLKAEVIEARRHKVNEIQNMLNLKAAGE